MTTNSLKLPRTLRLDPSDRFVLPRRPTGRMAVTGSFLYLDPDLAQLTAKEQAVFRRADFVGVVSLGFSTLVGDRDRGHQSRTLRTRR